MIPDTLSHRTYQGRIRQFVADVGVVGVLVWLVWLVWRCTAHAY